jgi:hypothetical protein
MAGGCCLLIACGSSGRSEADPSAPAGTSPPENVSPSTSPVDACALLSHAEAEALTGLKLLQPVKGDLPNPAMCSYGDPESPTLPDGRALAQIVILSVSAAEAGTYVGGPIAQAKATHEIGRQNAAAPQDVAGLGEQAYWDATLHALHVLKGHYEVSVDVPSKLGLAVARRVAERVLPRLP